jgi:hypothetical protein
MVYRTSVFNDRTDEPVDQPEWMAPPSAVRLAGLSFSTRSFCGCWDMSLLLQMSPDEALRRAMLRDAELMGGPDVVRTRYQRTLRHADRLRCCNPCRTYSPSAGRPAWHQACGWPLARRARARYPSQR